jgi:hypothetical protein
VIACSSGNLTPTVIRRHCAVAAASPFKEVFQVVFLGPSYLLAQHFDGAEAFGVSFVRNRGGSTSKVQ